MSALEALAIVAGGFGLFLAFCVVEAIVVGVVNAIRDAWAYHRGIR